MRSSGKVICNASWHDLPNRVEFLMTDTVDIGNAITILLYGLRTTVRLD